MRRTLADTYSGWNRIDEAFMSITSRIRVCPPSAGSIRLKWLTNGVSKCKMKRSLYFKGPVVV